MATDKLEVVHTESFQVERLREEIAMLKLVIADKDAKIKLYGDVISSREPSFLEGFRDMIGVIIMLFIGVAGLVLGARGIWWLVDALWPGTGCGT